MVILLKQITYISIELIWVERSNIQYIQDMTKNKSAKYKITDIDIDKKFIGKQVTVEKVKVKGGPGSDGGRKPPKQRKAPAWFIEFRDEQRVFNKQQLEFNTWIEKQVSNLRSDLNRIVKLNNLKH